MPRLLPSALSKAWPSDDADVFDRVVLIDVEVAASFQFEIEAAVVREQFEHVIEEADAGRDLITATAFDGQSDNSDVRLFAGAFDAAFSHSSDSLRQAEFCERFLKRAQQAVGVFARAERDADAAFATVVAGAVAHEDAAVAHGLDEGFAET